MHGNEPLAVIVGMEIVEALGFTGAGSDDRVGVALEPAGELGRRGPGQRSGRGDQRFHVREYAAAVQGDRLPAAHGGVDGGASEGLGGGAAGGVVYSAQRPALGTDGARKAAVITRQT